MAYFKNVTVHLYFKISGLCVTLREDFIQHADFAQIHAGNTTALFYYAVYNSADGDQVCSLPNCG